MNSFTVIYIKNILLERLLENNNNVNLMHMINNHRRVLTEKIKEDTPDNELLNKIPSMTVEQLINILNDFYNSLKK